MGLEVKCDSCGKNSIEVGNNVYCINCFDDLIDENKGLYKRIEELEKEIETINKNLVGGG